MQPGNQRTEANVDTRYRTMLILWFAFFSTIGMYFVISQFIQRPEGENAQNNIVTIALSGLGTFVALASLAVKQKFLKQSVEKQQVSLVQTGLIVATAMCEAGALFGLIDLLVTGNRYYFLVLIISAIVMVLHFPRRDQLLAASYKNRLAGGAAGE